MCTINASTVSRIIVDSIPFYGDNFQLKCIARRPPEGYGAHMQLEWFGPNGPISETDIVIGEQYVVNNTFQRNLTFSYAVPNMNGEYECRLTVHFDSSGDTHVEENKYHLEVMSKLTTITVWSLQFQRKLQYISPFAVP